MQFYLISLTPPVRQPYAKYCLLNLNKRLSVFFTFIPETLGFLFTLAISEIDKQ